MQAEVYTKNNCQYCTKAKILLKDNGISYKEFIVSPGFNEGTPLPHQTYVTKSQLIERLPTAKTVPQIWIDNQYIGGYIELVKYFDNI